MSRARKAIVAATVVHAFVRDRRWSEVCVYLVRRDLSNDRVVAKIEPPRPGDR